MITLPDSCFTVGQHSFTTQLPEVIPEEARTERTLHASSLDISEPKSIYMIVNEMEMCRLDLERLGHFQTEVASFLCPLKILLYEPLNVSLNISKMKQVA